MEKKLFIGIDFSKSKFDVAMLEPPGTRVIAHEVFENSTSGYREFTRWVSRQSRAPRGSWQFCGEHTGLYSRGLSDYLCARGLSMWLENPLQIKRCSGIKRGKTDSADATAIAIYSFRYQDRTRVYTTPSKEIDDLRMLAALRSRLVRERAGIMVAAKEMRMGMSRDTTARWICERSMAVAKRMTKEIDAVEGRMRGILAGSPLWRNYTLLTSIPGIGQQTAVALLIHTDNFEGFDNARQLASYCGCAPFPNQSGTVDKGSHVSHLADKELKVLLSMCSASAINHNPAIAVYYRRKVDQGKPKRLVLNNVRNKLLQIALAVVRRGEPYVELYTGQPAGLD